MIAFLKGEIKFLNLDAIVVLVEGIGYEVFVPNLQNEIGDTVELFIYEHIREDAHALYGFYDKASLELFERLIGINGVGVKLAQKILRFGSTENIRNVIAVGNIEALIEIPGVGKKLAQKIILELKGVLVEAQESPEDDDTIEALMSLGYSKNDCRKVLEKLTSTETDDRIKEALKILGSNG